MKIKFEEIYSKEMFPGLYIGTPKYSSYETELKEIEKLLGQDRPIHNLSEIKWKNITKEYGSWGHITGVKISINDGDDNYDFSIIFNFYQELEKLEDVIKTSIDSIDWKTNSFHWDAGDL